MRKGNLVILKADFESAPPDMSDSMESFPSNNPPAPPSRMERLKNFLIPGYQKQKASHERVLNWNQKKLVNEQALLKTGHHDNIADARSKFVKYATSAIPPGRLSNELHGVIHARGKQLGFHPEEVDSLLDQDFDTHDSLLEDIERHRQTMASKQPLPGNMGQ